MLSTLEKQVAWRCAEQKDSAAIPYTSIREMQSKIAALNRWRKKIVRKFHEDMMGSPESVFGHPLEYVRFCPRKDPPHILFDYDDVINRAITDSAGNTFTIKDLMQQEYDRLRELQQQDEQQPTEEEREEFIRELSERTGINMNEIENATGISAHVQQALDEAARQKGRPLTESERNTILDTLSDTGEFDIA